MKGKRHRLLIYDKVLKPRRGLFLLGALVSLLFYVVIAWPLVDQPTLNSWWLFWPADYDIVLLVASVVFFLTFLYKTVAPRLAYVQCAERNIRIQTPLYPLVLSYPRVVTTRPNQWGRIHPPETLTRRQRRVLDKVMGEGVLILDLKGWPVSRSFLKVWIPDVMFLPEGGGLVLWVPDWMTLSREISQYTDVRRDERLGPKPDASLYSRMMKDQ